MGLLNFFSKEKKETLDKGLEKDQTRLVRQIETRRCRQIENRR